MAAESDSDGPHIDIPIGREGAQRGGLRRLVEDKLALRWTPQQIARWLPRAHPEEPEWRVSHETIYLHRRGLARFQGLIHRRCAHA